MQSLIIKKNFFRKNITNLVFLILVLFIYFSPVILLATSTQPEPLQNLGIATSSYQEASEGDFTSYLDSLITLLIGIAASLAVIFITIGGVQYITTDSLSGKESGKETINNAILGLLIALASWLILNTINPDLIGKDDSFKIDTTYKSTISTHV